MIKYNLKCENNHEFESWFSSSDEFDNLNKKKLLECIYCTSKSIEKSIMAPMVSLVNSDKKKFNSLITIILVSINEILIKDITCIYFKDVLPFWNLSC